MFSLDEASKDLPTSLNRIESACAMKTCANKVLDDLLEIVQGFLGLGKQLALKVNRSVGDYRCPRSASGDMVIVR